MRSTLLTTAKLRNKIVYAQGSLQADDVWDLITGCVVVAA
jgi:hypothetical protein